MTITAQPESDHICEPGGFYANICAACKREIADGIECRSSLLERYTAPNEETARRNREEAARIRALLQPE